MLCYSETRISIKHFLMVCSPSVINYFDYHIEESYLSQT